VAEADVGLTFIGYAHLAYKWSSCASQYSTVKPLSPVVKVWPAPPWFMGLNPLYLYDNSSRKVLDT
jgi:hypothetical protein